jgi:hypothetical protein
LSNTFAGHKFKEMEFCSFLPDFDQAFHIQFILTKQEGKFEASNGEKEEKS